MVFPECILGGRNFCEGLIRLVIHTIFESIFLRGLSAHRIVETVRWLIATRFRECSIHLGAMSSQRTHKPKVLRNRRTCLRKIHILTPFHARSWFWGRVFPNNCTINFKNTSHKNYHFIRLEYQINCKIFHGIASFYNHDILIIIFK